MLQENDITQYCALKHQIKELETALKAIEDQLKNAMGDETEARLNGYIVRYTPVERHIIDTKRLKAEQPAMAEMYTTLSRTRQFTVRAW